MYSSQTNSSEDIAISIFLETKIKFGSFVKGYNSALNVPTASGKTHRHCFSYNPCQCSNLVCDGNSINYSHERGPRFRSLNRYKIIIHIQQRYEYTYTHTYTSTLKIYTIRYESWSFRDPRAHSVQCLRYIPYSYVSNISTLSCFLKCVNVNGWLVRTCYFFAVNFSVLYY